MRITGFVFAIVFFLISEPAAQTRLFFEHLSVENGLSLASVNCILQDQRGFLWIGTPDGLNRYDGYRFTVFRREAHNRSSLPNNYINALCEDQQGTLWIGTQHGLSSFDRNTARFTTHDYKNQHCALPVAVNALLQDRHKRLWMGTDKGLMSVDHGQLQCYHADTPAASVINNLHCDQSGIVWAATPSGLYRLDNPQKKLINAWAQHPRLANEYIFAIAEQQAGILWIATKTQGIVRYDSHSNEIKNYWIKNPQQNNTSAANMIEEIHIDQSGAIWVGANSAGLYKLNPQTGQLTNYRHDATAPGSLSNDNVYKIYQDRSGILWIGTRGGGINKVDFNHPTFLSWQENPLHSNSLSSNNVFGICEDHKGNLWIGTRGGGLNYLDRVTGKISVFRHNEKDPGSLSSDNVWSVREDRQHRVWVATSQGLNLFDPASKQFTTLGVQRGKPGQLSNEVVYSLFTDTKDRLWVGTYDGVNRYDPATNSFISFPAEKHPQVAHGNGRVYAFAEQDNGRLWMGTRGGGLRCLDPEKGTFDFYFHQPHDSLSLSSDHVYSLYKDKNQVLWMGTHEGLDRLDLKNLQKPVFKKYQTRHGLPGNVVYGIVPGTGGELWLSTSRGIARFNPEKETFATYDSKDGLPGDEFNGLAYAALRTGEVAFGGIKGVIVFSPSDFKKDTHLPQLILTDFKLFNKSVPVSSAGQPTVLEKSISETTHIELSYKHSFFSIEFTALNFRSPGKNFYAYRLEGFDQDWIYTDASQRQATYTNLSPGEYVFRVRAANRDKVWNQEGIRLLITILPPFWATMWFRLLLFVTAVAVLYMTYAIRVRRLEKRRRELEALVSQRTREIETQNHDLERAFVEINQQKEEIDAHLAFIEEKNQEITTAQIKIEEQNDLLKTTNQNLEEGVRQRTEELNRAYQAAVELNKELDMFFYRSSHDLRGPLARLIGLCNLALLEQDTQALSQYIRMLSGTAREMKKVLDRLMYIFETKQAQVCNAHFSLKNCLDKALASLTMQASTTISLELHTPDEICTDFQMLCVVIENLLQNAVLYHGDAPARVEVQSFQTENEIIIRITDHGTGIDEQFQKRIFDMFFVGVEKPQGLGLGLYTARVAGHKIGAKIRLAESRPGKTVFEVILPVQRK